jgi:RNA polymerase sigma-70 factor (ECF subfamily)
VSDVFESNRSRLFGIAYGMLGQVMDAEDVVQDTYLRWSDVDQATVDNPAAYLTTIVTRLAIDRLRSAQKRREEYVGPWVPEPILSADGGGTDPGDVVAEAEQISLALLTAMERLNPVERAVLLLRDVFDFDYPAIADIVDRSPVNTRQIAVRARAGVGDSSRLYSTTSERRDELMASFLAAMTAGDVGQLTAVLADDITLWSDGGGKARAALHPIVGVQPVARFLLGIRRNGRPGDTFGFAEANGDPAVVLARDGVTYAVMTFQLSDESVIGIRSVLNPDKLAHLTDVETPMPLVLE